MKIEQKNSKHSVPLGLRNWAKRIQNGKKFGSIRYPARFKAATLSLLRIGVKPRVLCNTLGISQISLSAWKKADERKLNMTERYPTGLRELTLIPNAPEGNQIQDRVRIQVGSKVWIEASASVLQGALLRELASLGVT
jgi:hypothetical protein